MDIVIIGLLLGGTYALMAMGLQLQYGVARIMNLANGEILIAGAFSTFWFYAGTKVSPLLALFLVAPAAFALNWAIYRVLIFPLVRRAKSQGKLEVDSILVTFGISFIGVGILLAIFGGEYLDYSYLAQPIFIFGERYGLNRVVAFLASAALCAGLYLWLHKTRAGLALRAVSVNPGAASLVSINVARASALAFALGGAVTAVGRRAAQHVPDFRCFARRGVHAQGAGHRHSRRRRRYSRHDRRLLHPRLCGDRRRHPGRSGPHARRRLHPVHGGPAGAAGRAVREADGVNAIEMPQVARARAGVTARERRNLLIGALIFVAAGLVPLVFGGYALQLAISIAMYTALATSWLLFSGPTNYIALSTAAFFGIGMYIVAAGHRTRALSGADRAGRRRRGGVRRRSSASRRCASPASISSSSTLGLAELVRQIMTWVQHVLGTKSGLYVTIDCRDRLLTGSCCRDGGWCFWSAGWIGRSRLGFALRIIGNDEVVAVHCGINTARAKVVLFVISSMFAAVAGALVAPRWSYVEPVVAFSPFVSFQVVIMALLGGTHRLWGPLVGVIPFVLIWELIAIDFPNQTTLLLGVCFLLIVYVIPNGIVGLIEDAMNRRATRRIGSGRCSAPSSLGGFSAEPAATAEEPQCLAPRPPRR